MAALLLLAVVPLTGQKKKPAIPVPDASWMPILSPASAITPSDALEVKRAASLARQTGQNRVAAIADSAAMAEDFLAAGANRLSLPVGAPADYLARACWFNGQGQPVRDVLLLESRLTDATRTAVETMLTLHRDFDLATPNTFAKLPMALKPAGQDEPGSFSVGAATYHVMAIAPSDFWPEEILDTLLDYINSGGRVVFVGRQPLSIQRLLFRTGVVRVGDGAEDIARGLNAAESTDFHAEIQDTGERAESIRYQHRTDGKRDYFYVLNSDRRHAVSVRMGFAATGSIEEWDLHTGMSTPIKLLQREIPAGGTVAFVVTKAH